ncbi:hypothetical protein VD0004_g5794 [Verticillium dahliae]|nr:hypothetical protein VD0004_g5794 [Verticillium dahliae]PNH67149.1 hypothetical protein VD0001_g7905 [Verticillium dahliae]
MLPGAEASVKLTPITGRLSRAKKGVPVHTCDQCRPPKTFTRAEHLRRHQLSHDTPRYACTIPGCDRAFHRKDLLDRHQQRHELDEEKSPRSRRTSAGSLDGGARLGLHPSVMSYSTPSTTPNLSMTPNMAPNISAFLGSPGSASKSMSPGMGGGSENYPSASGSHGYNNDYQLSSHSPQQLPLLHDGTASGFNTPASMIVPTFTSIDYSQPRTNTTYSQLYLQTQGLPSQQTPAMDAPPELSHPYDTSNWPSSASDSPFSTPSERSRRGPWADAQRSSSVDWQGTNLLSPYVSHEHSSPSPGFDTLPASGPLYFPFSPSPQLGSGPVFVPSLDAPLTNYPDDQTLLDPHQQHLFPNSVGNPVPVRALAQAQSSEILVSPSTALLSDRMMNSLACVGRQKEVAVGLMAAPILSPSSLAPPPASAYRAIPYYIEVYWDKFHHLFPIVHRRTFEEALEQCDLLRCAMAAVATQYLTGKEDRIRGNQLHEYAWQQARRSPHWSVSVMQAILLCELFARFRGRKAAIRPSKEFENVYQRVNDPSVIFAPVPMSGPSNVRWHTWLDMEARRRLLGACFVLDVHTSVYQEQRRVREFDIAAEGIPSIPLTGHTNELWEAMSADAWSAMVANKENIMSMLTTLPMINPGSLTDCTIQTHSLFDRSIILASEAIRLQSQGSAAPSDPSRMAGLFPDCPVANTYLALHHAPLHDLLAVSGESWVFSQKLMEASSFAEHKKRLRQWSSSSEAATSVIFACRAMEAFTAQGNRRDADEDDEDADNMDIWDTQRPRTWRDDVSDYWGMYVCALICWAFGHGASADEMEDATMVREGAGEAATLAWVRAVARMGEKDVMKIRNLQDSTKVVELARSWLEADCIGNRSRLFVDAVRVLRKLEEGVQWA